MADPGTIANTNREPVYVAHGGTILGYSDEGDVTVTITSDWSDQTFAQTGTYVVDSFMTGVQATVEVTISQILDFDKWAVALPYGRKQDDTTTPTPENRFVAVDSADTVLGLHIGQKASTFAAELKIMPGASGSTPTTETARDFWAPKTYVSEVGPILFGVNGPQSLSCTFRILYDPDADEGENFFIFGKKTETWTDS